jgi:hypothetical protein
MSRAEGAPTGRLLPTPSLPSVRQKTPYFSPFLLAQAYFRPYYYPKKGGDHV